MEKKSIFQELFLVQSDIKPIIATGKGKISSKEYKYIKLDELIDIVKPIMLQHGIMFYQRCTDEGVNTIIYNQEGETIESGFLSIDATQLTNNAVSLAQAQGIAITYAKRYQLSSLLGISIDEDTDANKGNTTQTTTQQKKVTQSAPKQPETKKPESKKKPDFSVFRQKHLENIVKGYHDKMKSIEDSFSENVIADIKESNVIVISGLRDFLFKFKSFTETMKLDIISIDERLDIWGNQ